MNNEHEAIQIGELEQQVESLRHEVLRTRRVMGYWFWSAFVVFALRDVFFGRQVWVLVVLASPVVLLVYLILCWSDRRIQALKKSRGVDFEPSHAERMNPSKLFTSQKASQGL